MLHVLHAFFLPVFLPCLPGHGRCSENGDSPAFAAATAARSVRGEVGVAALEERRTLDIVVREKIHHAFMRGTEHVRSEALDAHHVATAGKIVFMSRLFVRSCNVCTEWCSQSVQRSVVQCSAVLSVNAELFVEKLAFLGEHGDTRIVEITRKHAKQRWQAFVCHVAVQLKTPGSTRVRTQAITAAM